MPRNYAQDFLDVQRRQWRISLFLVPLLILFYFLAIALICFVFLAGFSLFVSGSLLKSDILVKFISGSAVVAVLIALLHFYDARKNGAKFIRRRLQAQNPDRSDRYHRMFTNTVEEMRVACGLPKVNAFILPQFASNSMALIEPDNTPDILVTEGLLAEFTRDEIQTVVAHELAHIIRGDSYYITLVCSLANIFERAKLALEPELETPGAAQSQSGGGPPLLYAAVALSAVVMRLLSMLISRQREIMADAVAVDISRHPRALARAIFKAHIKNSFIGDFSLSYSPLLIVPPESREITDGFLSRIFNSHPPLMKRIGILASIGHTSPAEIIEEVRHIHKNREETRMTLTSQEELPEGLRTEVRADRERPQAEGRVWSIRNPDGAWQKDLTLEEVLFAPFFTPMIRIRNQQEDVTASAREFPQIRLALHNMLHKKPLAAEKRNRCPRCHIPLKDRFYEGVSIKACSECGGKLIDSELIGRIIARKEAAFSEHLIEKAESFREEFYSNPMGLKLKLQESPVVFCPDCGGKMLPRPYHYHYVVPVDKCFSCQKIWFDADELEILQILIENRPK